MHITVIVLTLLCRQFTRWYHQWWRCLRMNPHQRKEQIRFSDRWTLTMMVRLVFYFMCLLLWRVFVAVNKWLMVRMGYTTMLNKISIDHYLERNYHIKTAKNIVTSWKISYVIAFDIIHLHTSQFGEQQEIWKMGDRERKRQREKQDVI